MKYLILLLITVCFTSCENPNTVRAALPEDNVWSERFAKITKPDSLLIKGSTYLPIYSEIYQRNQNFTFDLTATVSMRNISLKDTIYIYTADYYNTHGELIHKYLDHPVFVRPMETIEIVVDEDDKKGGTGGNFVFDWAVNKNSLTPFFEAVMISTTGQQGLSFTTHGIRKK
jgi:hypothetical protein